MFKKLKEHVAFLQELHLTAIEHSQLNKMFFPHHANKGIKEM